MHLQNYWGRSSILYSDGVNLQQTCIFDKESQDDIIFQGGGQKDGWDPVFSGGAGQSGEEVQETGENLRWKWKWHG